MGWWIFSVPGPPVPWRRAGRNKTTGVSYTHPKCGAAKTALLWCARQARIPMRSLPDAFFLTVRVWIPRPKVAHPDLPVKQRTGDVDNYSKLVMDAMNEVVFRDDAQIVGLLVLKDWADVDCPPGTEVGLTAVSALSWRALMRRKLGSCLLAIARGKLSD